MAISGVLHSVQYVVNESGERTAALLDIEAWETLVDWIEMIVDTTVAGQALTELSAAGGRPQQAGWLAWDNLRELWNEEVQFDAAIA